MGFGLPGETNGHCPANWHNLLRSQRVLGGKCSLHSPCWAPGGSWLVGRTPAAKGVSLVKPWAPMGGLHPVPCSASDMHGSDVSIQSFHPKLCLKALKRNKHF